MNTVFKTLKKNKIIYGTWRRAKLFARRIVHLKYNNYPGLHGRISHRDGMFSGDIRHYMSVGDSAIANIESALKAAGKSLSSSKSILDIPSGHGRVLRLLAANVSPDQITACDLDEDGIEFCAKEFGCKKILSNRDLSKIHFPENYSLIWVGSLFTHVDEAPFADLLKLLFNSLEPDGVLVFTTHGKFSVEVFDRYWKWDANGVPLSNAQLQKELAKNKGFYYAPYYNSKEYGISISLAPYVTSLIESLFKGKAKVIFFNEKGWDDHQDVFAIQKVNE